MDVIQAILNLDVLYVLDILCWLEPNVFYYLSPTSLIPFRKIVNISSSCTPVPTFHIISFYLYNHMRRQLKSSLHNESSLHIKQLKKQ